MNDEADLDIARGPVPGAPLHASNHEKSARTAGKADPGPGLSAARRSAGKYHRDRS